jgi:LysM repeat protein
LRKEVEKKIIQMKKLLATSAFICLFINLFSQSSLVVKNYIEEFKAVAIEEMQRTGVPAAITLAQGIHETSAGQSPLVIKSNNHFGIKCKSDWQGPSVFHDDDARGECFRKYTSPFDSYKDHSDFLATRSHYAFLFKLDPTDYEAWAYGLKKAGYATNPKYPQILIKLIRDYHLDDYTLIAMNQKPVEKQSGHWSDKSSIGDRTANNTSVVDAPLPERVKASYPSGVFKINDTRVVYITKGTSFLSIAYDYNVPLKRLFEFNDMFSQEVASTDQLIFIQRKRKTGADEYYKIAGSETLYEISQKQGIRFESLLAYNHLRAEMTPQPGELLYLQRQAPAMPKLATATVVINSISQSNNLAKSSDDIETTDFIIHTVQPKETMFSIAKKYAVDQTEVLKWNKLESTDLRWGQQIRIKRM